MIQVRQTYPPQMKTALTPSKRETISHAGSPLTDTSPLALSPDSMPKYPFIGALNPVLKFSGRIQSLYPTTSMAKNEYEKKYSDSLKKYNSGRADIDSSLGQLQSELKEMDRQLELSDKMTKCIERIESQLKAGKDVEGFYIRQEEAEAGQKVYDSPLNLNINREDYQTLMDGFECTIKETQERHQKLLHKLRRIPGFRTALTASGVNYNSATIDPFLRETLNILVKEMADTTASVERLQKIVQILDKLEWEHDASVSRSKPEYIELYKSNPSPKLQASILNRMKARKQLRPSSKQYQSFIQTAVQSPDNTLKNMGLQALQASPFLSAPVIQELQRILGSEELEDIQMADLAVSCTIALNRVIPENTAPSPIPNVNRALRESLQALNQQLTLYQQNNMTEVQFALQFPSNSGLAPEMIAWNHLSQAKPLGSLNDSKVLEAMLNPEAMEGIADNLRRSSQDPAQKTILQNKLCYVFSQESNPQARMFWEELAMKAYRTPLIVIAGVGGLKAVMGMDKEKKVIETQIINPIVNNSPNLHSAVLFYGPGGTGKSFLVKQVAEHLGYPIYKVNYSELLTNENGAAFFGETTARINNLFESAKQKGPIVLWFDEMDSASKNKKDAANASAVDNTNLLMANVDRLQQYNQENPEKKVIVMGTANYLKVLESTSYRPGRFYLMEINPSDTKTKLEILAHYLAQKKHALTPEIQTLFNQIASDEVNLYAGDLEQIIREACNYAHDEEFSTTHLQEAYKDVRKQRITVNDNTY